jgi:alkylated DNA repair dioxygenase AlkB
MVKMFPHLGETFGHKLLDDVWSELNKSTQWNNSVGNSPKGCATMWFTQRPCKCSYSYGHNTVESYQMSPKLCELMSRVKSVLGLSACSFNSVNANYYHDGNACIPWHADNEVLFSAAGESILIASLSLGGDRQFEIGGKDSVVLAGTTLSHGDLLTMEGMCQQEVLHRVPKEKKMCKPRINLTFREIRRHKQPCPLAPS